MGTDRLFIADNSGDKKYFTQIPNIVPALAKANEQSLYLVMKSVAGEAGVCWAGTRELAARMGVSRATAKKALAALLKRRWIEYIGERNLATGGGRQPVKCYRVLDIWPENLAYFEGGSILTHPELSTPPKVGQTGPIGGSILTRGGSKTTKGGSNWTPNNIRKDNNINIGGLFQNQPDPRTYSQGEAIPKEIPEEFRAAVKKLKGELEDEKR